MNPKPIDQLLAWPPVDRTRRNHGLEHATITLLAQRFKHQSLAGRSTPAGFHLYGNVPVEAIAEAAEEALRRMRAGEAGLAIHPNCGTNFVVSGVAAAAAAYLGFAGAHSRRDRWERLPLVAALTTLALIFAQPVGYAVQQRVTTSGRPGALEIVSVRRLGGGRMPHHFVATRG